MKAYRRVENKSDEIPTDWRTAAYMIALSRLEAVYKGRGLFP
jgi:glutamate dehydrogenase (NAD(P)+)